MENKQYKSNLDWIRSGATGCNFATLFSKKPEAVGWKIYTWHEYIFECHHGNKFKDDLIISIEFTDNETWTKDVVKSWALLNGFYLEDTSDKTEGLRIDVPEGKAWVQYFGPDSHVVTRRSPTPMLMYCNKLNKSYYVKVGFKGILHLAHAWYDKISDRVYDLLWQRSYKQTEKKLGHKPTIFEASKTTFLK